jgi:hypothetical protein
MNIDGNLLKIPTYHPQKVQRDEEQWNALPLSVWHRKFHYIHISLIYSY